MLAIIPPDRDREREGSAAKAPEALVVTVERHAYEPSAGNRIVGLIATTVVYLLMLVGFFFTITTSVGKRPEPPALTVLDLKALASPPETPPKETQAPSPVEKQTPPSERVSPRATPMLAPVLPVTVSVPAVAPSTVDPAPSEPEIVAPKISNKGPDSWEGRVLAALNKERRYPRIALMRRQQGVPYVRFVMDRDGKVLSSRLERSSGFPDLDREAVALPKRAQPLPKPPDDKQGETLELVVPVEFFVR